VGEELVDPRRRVGLYAEEHVAEAGKRGQTLPLDTVPPTQAALGCAGRYGLAASTQAAQGENGIDAAGAPALTRLCL
jgi:hypothetical protein